MQQFIGHVATPTAIGLQVNTGELEVIPKTGFPNTESYRQFVDHVVGTINTDQQKQLEPPTSDGTVDMELSGRFDTSELNCFWEHSEKLLGTSTRKVYCKTLIFSTLFLVLMLGSLLFLQHRKFGEIRWDLILSGKLLISMGLLFAVFNIVPRLSIWLARFQLSEQQHVWQLTNKGIRVITDSHQSTRHWESIPSATQLDVGLIFELPDPVDLILLPRSSCTDPEKWEQVVDLVRQRVSVIEVAN